MNQIYAGLSVNDWIALNSYAFPIETLNSSTKIKFILIFKMWDLTWPETHDIVLSPYCFTRPSVKPNLLPLPSLHPRIDLGKTLWNLYIFDNSTYVLIWTNGNALPMQEWPVCDMMNPALHWHWNDPWTFRHLPLAHMPFLSHSLWSVTRTIIGRNYRTINQVTIFIL